MFRYILNGKVTKDRLTCERLVIWRLFGLSSVAAASRARRFRSSFSWRACWIKQNFNNIWKRATKQTWYARWNLTNIEKKFEGVCVRGASPSIKRQNFHFGHKNKISDEFFLPKYSTHWLNTSCASFASFTKRSILSWATLTNSSNDRVSIF